MKSIKIRGYVTEVRSQTSFDLDDYRILREETVQLEFEKDDDGEPLSPDVPKEIRVGTQIEIKGDYNSETHELKAKSMKVFPGDTRRLKRTALVEKMPQLTRKPTYWEGTIQADGQTILVDERTKVTIVPNQSQKKAQKQAAKEAAKGGKSASAETDEASPGVALVRLDDVHPNMFVAYEGQRMDDGRVWATKLQFKDNELTSGETKLWKSLAPKVKSFKEGRPGELQIGKAGKFKTAPNEALQHYARRLGESLIPASQKSLQAGDPTKIPFQFYVAEAKVPNAFATANGVVVVQVPMFQCVENEAQLAFVLSHEIAHATQEHTIRQYEFHKKKRMALQIAAIAAASYGYYNVSDLLALTAAAITNGYQRYLENQADRLGMQYMLDAGYDPREAPRAWKAMASKTGDAPTDFFWSSHDNNATRRSYLMSELRLNYPGVDFGSKKRDSDEFHTITGALPVAGAKTKPGKTVKVK